MKILILCTGNSARSQMAHGILQALNADLHVYSAGTNPAKRVHPMAVKALKEFDIDISHHVPMHVDHYGKERWDYVITVCDDAEKQCPIFKGKVKHRIHIGFEDPVQECDSKEVLLEKFKEIRNLILIEFFKLNMKSFV